MNQTEQTTAKENFATLMGGIDLVVKLQDGSTEQVKVLQLGVDKYQELAGKLGDERDQVEMYCQRDRGQKAEDGGQSWEAVPKGWAKLLTPMSHFHVMETAEKLNKDFFEAWLRRRMAMIEAIRPGAVDVILKDSTSPNSSPKRPSPAA